ncbi:hypothetical protein SNE40_000261 [Patella caerulea]|uniref:Anaphase-promoting complex subunit CDC26 n=1 Tax=Patella caerulea TaxID=87958 RepID=A0AAN8Q6S9_PATCE
MLRNDPTRIELKIDDLEEYEIVKKENLEGQQKTAGESGNSVNSSLHLTGADSFGIMLPLGNRPETIHARIGYDPKPTPQSSGLPIHR